VLPPTCALARSLIALGVKPGDRVALRGEPAGWLISDLAIMAVGAIWCPPSPPTRSTTTGTS
jgi:long-subunit acyl-CoA synthetase (AMP-forming)